jgi:hypothetical protein
MIVGCENVRATTHQCLHNGQMTPATGQVQRSVTAIVFRLNIRSSTSCAIAIVGAQQPGDNGQMASPAGKVKSRPAVIAYRFNVGSMLPQILDKSHVTTVAGPV